MEFIYKRQERFDECDTLKFVMIDVGEKTIAVIGTYDAMPSHSDEVDRIIKEKGGDFVGAGLVKRYSHEVCFESDTCYKKFGRDRPKDDSRGEKLLKEIKDKLMKEDLLPELF